MTVALDEKRALKQVLELLAIPGPSGREGAVARAIRQKLRAAGVPAADIRFDRTNERIARATGRDPADFEIGNLIVQLPGTRRGPRRMFLGHMDTVPLCRGARPVVKGDLIRPASPDTALGADNRSAVAILVTMIETLVRNRLPHPPLSVVFTICEEIGLYGAKYLRLSEVGRPAMAFNFDSNAPERIIIGAIGATKWEADIHGISSHAGVRPEAGVSAILIAARAIERVAARGYFGAIAKGRRRGKANVGVIRGGEATNEITRHVFVRGECRSHDARFLKRISEEWRAAFQWAARSVRNNKGECGRVDFRLAGDYEAFRLRESHPAVQFAFRAARSVGLRPEATTMDGGLDANPLNAAGVPTVTLGTGQRNPHSLDEHLIIPEYFAACRLALELATAAD